MSLKFLAAIESVRRKIPRTLFHYTKADSIQYLVRKDSDIKCTHSNFLNDPKEIWTGCESFIRHLRNRRTVSSRLIDLIESNLRDNSLTEKIAWNGYSRLMPFTFSFTENDDDEYQWKSYTDDVDGGYQIAFNGCLLNRCAFVSQLLNGQPGVIGRMSLDLSPCFYEETNASEIECIFDALIADMKNLLTILEKDPKNPVGRMLLSKVFTVAPLIKAERWHVEKEWRMVLVPETWDESMLENNRISSCARLLGNGMQGLIRWIRISPHGDQKWLRNHLESEASHFKRLKVKRSRL